MMRQDDSRRPVWEFADWVQITRSVLEAQWKALVVPSVDAPLQARENVGVVVARGRSCHLSGL